MPTEQAPTITRLIPDIQQLIAEAGGTAETALLTGLIETVLRSRTLERGDLKVMHRTVRELRYALSVFERYRDVRKVTVFGSAYGRGRLHGHHGRGRGHHAGRARGRRA